jgi:hypothetical protein
MQTLLKQPVLPRLGSRPQPQQQCRQQQQQRSRAAADLLLLLEASSGAVSSLLNFCMGRG